MIPFQYITAFILLVLGLFCVLYKTNLIKMVIGIDILESGIHLLLISLGYKYTLGDILPTAPIYVGYETGEMVGPLPQALVLTSIVIGVCVLALALSITIQVYRHFGTLDSRKIRSLRG